ncbi:ACT domain-containing protein [Christensenella massiliensis]|uniref:ACT domain-containing protein n=1 Tax=Christensenella massiliensis TaxID=1805714 RepID=UPI003364CB13
MEDIISGKKIVSSIYAEEENNAIVTLINVPHDPAYIANVFDIIAHNSINIDTISQAYPQNGTVDITFSVASPALDAVKAALDTVDGLEYKAISGITTLVIEGDGMARQYGVASKLFSALAADRIKTYIITNSHTRISFCLQSTDVTKAIKAVTQAFDL